eukprot:gnl/TRDRNA2_/TRDRNA2_29625_c0_seq2.p2 gnl/TRDRNA2_/TRDRNA2_29625_c0~~gnl/TRDRNA2_/TRDRNA2_29625_c0_seq2.p2  ORF type:complete len:146 (-),score=23.22 gnl/TRDRNA2_/TRDRNA2_29625_c0_seq2:46-483(-)
MTTDTAWADFHAGDAVKDEMQPSTFPPPASVARMRASKTKRTGSWSSWRPKWTANHRLRGRAQLLQLDQWKHKKQAQTVQTRSPPTPLNSIMDWMKAHAAAGSWRTIDTICESELPPWDAKNELATPANCRHIRFVGSSIAAAVV